MRNSFRGILDRGVDINAVVPETAPDCAGCTLLLCTIESGLHDSNEYADALHLVDRGADPHRVAADAMTLSKMLTAQLGRHPPQAFTQLWAQGHGIVSESE
jgi:hypothetical protein